MNNIFKWSIGSFFRTFGRIFAYLLVGLLLGLFMQKNGIKFTDLLGIDRIYASEIINNDYEKYSIREYNTNIADYTWTSWLNTGTQYVNNQGNYYLSGIRTRFGYTSKFQKGTTYRVKVNVILNNGSQYRYFKPNEIKCFGSVNDNNDMNEDLIDTCNFVSMVLYENNTRAHFYFDVKPNTNIYSLQVQWYYNYNNTINSNMSIIAPLQIGTGSNLSYDNSEMEAINNQTNTLINNNNQNTQEIINNQNELLGSKCTNIFDENKTSTSYNLTKILDFNKIILNVTGTWSNLNYNNYPVEKNKDYKFTLKYENTTNKNALFGVYKLNGDIIKEQYFEGTSGTSSLTFNSGNNTQIQIRFFGSTSSWSENNTLTYKDIFIGPVDKNYCEYGSTISKLDEQTQAINDLNNSINDDNTSGATSSAGGFFSSFNTNTHGLTGIITAPLNAINSLTSKTCSPLVLPLPYVNQNLTLPCMRPIYDDNFGGFMYIYDVVVIGIVSYWILVRIFALVKDFKNPEHDEIEVMDL